MAFTRNIDIERRAYIKLLLINNYSYRKISKLTKSSTSSIARIRKTLDMKSTEMKETSVKRHKAGRPKKLSIRQERRLVRGIKRLRIEEGTFSSKRLMQQCSLSEGDVSNRTIRRYLNRNGFKFLQARKKGLLSEKDKHERLKFARSMRRYYSRNVWEKEIAFYLDATSFVYKRHPMDQARAPRGRIWRKVSEGLDPGCTAKGRKEGSGGKIVHIMAAISYGQPVLIAEPFVKMNGQYFESFIDNNFNSLFQRANNNDRRYRLWVQDGDPSQNSARAKRAMSRANAVLLSIPARSPDINPIENIFHLVSKKLRRDALELRIKFESYKQFEERVIKTIRSIPVDVINKTILSMDKRMTSIIKRDGGRIKY